MNLYGPRTTSSQERDCHRSVPRGLPQNEECTHVHMATGREHWLDMTQLTNDITCKRKRTWKLARQGVRPGQRRGHRSTMRISAASLPQTRQHVSCLQVIAMSDGANVCLAHIFIFSNMCVYHILIQKEVNGMCSAQREKYRNDVCKLNIMLVNDVCYIDRVG